MNLTLAVKKQWFDDIKAGVKLEEYREQTPYWQKRLENRNYDKVIITMGYPKRDDMARRIEFDYAGYDKKTITHPHFGNRPTDVYAIKLERD